MSANVLKSTNPATKQIVWEGAIADEVAIDTAMRVAKQVFPTWAKRPVQERIAIVEQYKQVLERHAEELARIIAQETGKVLWDARGEMQAMIGKVAISIEAYQDRTGYKSTENNGVKAVLRHKPHGVIAVFGPYNFPGHLPNGHIVPALIAGNVVVFKPSEYTPYIAERMVQCWEEAGLPKNVLHLVQGGRETGVALAAHPLLNGLYFTGSAEVGALLHKQFAGKPEVVLALEMGGNTPLIVTDVQDIKAAASVIAQSAFITTGQRCTCARRLIIPKGSEGDNIINALIEIAANIQIGGYDDNPEPFMGCLIGEREAQKMLDAQTHLISLGAKPLLEMHAQQDNIAFLSPGILDVTAVSSLPDREYFGPLLQVIRVKDMDEALQVANNTRYGLAAGIITRDAQLHARFVEEIHAGVITWNRPTTGASSALPFGGVGISGNYRPSAYYAADYCAYPVSAQESDMLTLGKLPPGMVL